ncbi:MAG: serine/threonine protein kinase [Planctomycetes bacterium]|nr:serine/threonine protein kinase [Planctomycetota bacterium]
MTNPLWRRIESVFDQASRLVGMERKSYLDHACGKDHRLRDEVESLLAADASSDDPIAETVIRAGIMQQGVGTRCGPYRLNEVIGIGGMGAVFAATREDDQYRQKVAIKLIRSMAAGPEAETRFRRERQALADLDHVGIARLLDGGTTADGQPYLVMEFIEGKTLDRWCEDTAPSLRRRLEIFCSICSAVHHAHRNLIVHRDIKHANILVNQNGQPKLLDFGIAKILENENQPMATTRRLLTPEYASPEQFQSGPITTATDVYLLGVVLFQLLTGCKPFIKDEQPTHELVRRICEESPPLASAVCQHNSRQLRGDLDNIVAMALRKEPGRRYGSAEKLAEDIQRHLKGLPVDARKDTLRYRAGKFVKRNLIPVGAATILMVTLTASLIVVLNALNRERLQSAQKDGLIQASMGFLDVNPYFFEGGVEWSKLRIALDAAAELYPTLDFATPEDEIAFLKRMEDGFSRLSLSGSSNPYRDRIFELTMSLPGDHELQMASYLLATGKAEEALEIRQRLLPTPHRDIAECLLSIASQASNAHAADQAKKLYEQTRKMLTQIPTQSPDPLLVTVLEREAGFLHSIGSNQQALIRIQAAVETVTALRPRDALAEVNCLMVQGWLIQDMGNYAEAVRLLRNVVAKVETLYPPGHPVIAEAWFNLGLALKDFGEFSEAENVIRKAISITNSVAFVEERFRHYYDHGLAMVFADQGDWEKAYVYAQASVDSYQQRFGDTSLSTSPWQTLLGRILIRLDRATEALPYLLKAHKTRSEEMVWQRWERHKTASILGEAYLHLGQFQKAEALLNIHVPELVKLRGPAHYRSGQALQRQVDLYEAMGKPVLAQKYREQITAEARATPIFRASRHAD